MCVSMYVLGHTCESQKAMFSSQFSTATFEVGYLLLLTLWGYSRSASSWGQADPPISTLKGCNYRCVTIYMFFFLTWCPRSTQIIWLGKKMLLRREIVEQPLISLNPFWISCSTRIIDSKKHGELCIVRTDRNNHAGNTSYLSTKRRMPQRTKEHAVRQ